jgi:hypothetical protein
VLFRSEFHHLIKQLREDEVKFKEYFRMNTNQFNNLLSLIEDEIEKKKLRFPLPIFIPPIAPQSSSPIIWGWYNRPEVVAVQGT